MTHEKDLYNSRRFKLSDCVAVIKKSTLDKAEIERIQHAFYIDTVKAVMHESYKGNLPFDAFSQNIFYINDLEDGKFITGEEAERLIISNAIFYTEAEDREERK